jgi:transcriptional regulator with GAF, ATPase, and Fis domain
VKGKERAESQRRPIPGIFLVANRLSAARLLNMTETRPSYFTAWLSNMKEQLPGNDFILSAWREACRHIAIAEFAAVLAEMLATRLPLGRFAIRLINAETSHVDTVAETSVRAPTADEVVFHETSMTRWDEQEMRKLVRWCRQGELKVKTGQRRSQHVAFAAIPSSWSGETLVGPLVSEHGTLGLMLVELASPNTFKPAHEQLLQQLLEPLAVALENDQRLRELGALREAAESEKRSLLARLGREDLSEAIIGSSWSHDPTCRCCCLAKPAPAKRWWPERFTTARWRRTVRSFASTAAPFRRS